MIYKTDKGKLDAYYEKNDTKYVRVNGRYYRAEMRAQGYDRYWKCIEEVRYEKGRFLKKFCACCQGNTISEDPAAAKHDLCDRCYDRFNQRDYDDFITARKGE